MMHCFVPWTVVQGQSAHLSLGFFRGTNVLGKSRTHTTHTTDTIKYATRSYVSPMVFLHALVMQLRSKLAAFLVESVAERTVRNFISSLSVETSAEGLSPHPNQEPK